jgi:hypothetical protein
MKSVTGLIVAAALTAIAGGVCLAIGLLDRDLAQAQQQTAMALYTEPDAVFAKAERYFEYLSQLPWVGNDSVNEMRARRAALKYWQRQYRAILPTQSDPVSSIASDNIDLQLVVANAALRSAQAQATDRESLLATLDTGISGYLTVLKNAERQVEAAYNYEYLIRLRNEIEKGTRKPLIPSPKGPDGMAGAPLAAPDRPAFKLYIPLENDERQQEGEAGKAKPTPRKG